jgi:hypothetical protein
VMQPQAPQESLNAHRFPHSSMFDHIFNNSYLHNFFTELVRSVFCGCEDC